MGYASFHSHVAPDNLTAACDAVTATIYKVTRGADATATSVDFSYDTGHDTAAEPYDVDEHRMTLTIITPDRIDNDEYYLVELSINGASSSVIDLIAAVANFTLKA